MPRACASFTLAVVPSETSLSLSLTFFSPTMKRIKKRNIDLSLCFLCSLACCPPRVALWRHPCPFVKMLALFFFCAYAFQKKTKWPETQRGGRHTDRYLKKKSLRENHLCVSFLACAFAILVCPFSFFFLCRHLCCYGLFPFKQAKKLGQTKKRRKNHACWGVDTRPRAR